MNDTVSRDLTARRARFCYEEVDGWRGRSWRKEAEQRVKGLAVQIRKQGLMVALATLMADDRDHSRYLAELLARWLGEAPHFVGRLQPAASGRGRSLPATLLDACAKAERADLAAAEYEAIEFFDQVKLYADALSQEQGR